MLVSVARDIQPRPLTGDDLEDLKLVVMQEGVEVLFYGIQATLLVAALAALTRGKNWSRPVTACIVALFLSSTCTMTVAILTNVVQMPSLGLNAESALPELLNKLNIAFIAATRFNYVMSDTIVVWRVWILYRGSRLVRGALLLCLLGSFVGVLIECVTYIKAPKNGLQSSAIMMEIPLLITNAVSTILVAIRFWYYLRDVKNLISDWRKTSRTERIFILLLESGTLYCILWVVRFGIDLYDGAGTVYLVYSVIGAAYPPMAGILPTLILLVVATRRSATTSLLLSTQVSQGMRFADGAETQGRSLTTLDETQLDSLDETQLNSMDGRTFTSGRTASMASPKNAKDLPLEDLGRVRRK